MPIYIPKKDVDSIGFLHWEQINKLLLEYKKDEWTLRIRVSVGSPTYGGTLHHNFHPIASVSENGSFYVVERQLIELYYAHAHNAYYTNKAG